MCVKRGDHLDSVPCFICSLSFSFSFFRHLSDRSSSQWWSSQVIKPRRQFLAETISHSNSVYHLPPPRFFSFNDIFGNLCTLFFQIFFRVYIYSVILIFFIIFLFWWQESFFLRHFYLCIIKTCSLEEKKKKKQGRMFFFFVKMPDFSYSTPMVCFVATRCHRCHICILYINNIVDRV